MIYWDINEIRILFRSKCILFKRRVNKKLSDRLFWENAMKEVRFTGDKVNLQIDISK